MLKVDLSLRIRSEFYTCIIVIYTCKNDITVKLFTESSNSGQSNAFIAPGNLGT